MTLIPFEPSNDGKPATLAIHPAIDGVPKGSLRVTVTYLGMDTAPTGPVMPPPYGQKLALIRAEQPSLSFYRYLYDTVGEPWLWYDRRRMATHVLKETIIDDRVEIFVLYASGVPAGFAELDCRQEKITDLAYFGLIPDYIGRGLGPFLLDSAIRRAWDREIDQLTVNTCSFDHPK
ncbi:MAG: GNAT family N-acetyltransferase, partial [Pseudomonadota bacterium]